MIPPQQKTQKRDAGNIFLVLFAAMGAVGILGVALTTFIKGPMSTAVNLTRVNTASAQMAIAAQTAVMASANTSTSGDCDNDGYIEPQEWRLASGQPTPTNGQLIPSTVANNTIDPWGNNFGYCAWDHGLTMLASGCQQTTVGVNMRLEGSNSKLYPVVAVISSGPDKTFQTTCRPFATGASRADQNNNGTLGDAGDYDLVSKTAGSDDIIFTYTYEEATGASGGLWSLKSGDATTATISKNIQAQDATFSGTGTFGSVGVSGTAADCTGLGTASYNDPTTGHCYYKSGSGFSVTTATTACNANGGYLAAITSSAENALLLTQLSLTSAANYWIGVSDSAVEGEWRYTGGEYSGTQFWSGDYSTGSAVNSMYSNWNAGLSAPANDAAKNYATLDAPGGKWHDSSGASGVYYLCEKSPIQTPLTLNSGIRLATPTAMPNCNSTNTGALRRNASSLAIELCNGTSWTSLGNSTSIDNFSDGIADYVKNNLFVGPSAGNETAFGNGVTGGNVALGTGNIMASLTSGIGNTAFGSQALWFLVSANYNTAIGARALTTLKNGVGNTAVGYAACATLGYAMPSYNTCIGSTSVSTSASWGVTAIGYAALKNNSGATQNVAVGHSAAFSDTTGDKNVAFGTSSLNLNVSGIQNTALGYNTLSKVTTGGNTAIGYNALCNVTTGNPNLALGTQVMTSEITGSNNTGIGFQAVPGGSNARVTAAGYKALGSLTAGTDTTAVGYYAGNASLGSSSVHIGFQAGGLGSQSNTTVVGNAAMTPASLTVLTSGTGGGVAVGYNALKGSMIQSTTNTAVGASAGASIGNSGLYNVALGFRTLFQTTSSYNTAIGYSALYSLASNGSNTAIGHHALFLSDASDNTAAGDFVMDSTTSGGQNTAIGHQALNNNTIGARNVSIGSTAQFSSINGNDNTSLGHSSLYTNISGSQNVAAGYGALYNNKVSGNVAVGYQSLYSLISATGVTAVGYQAGYSHTTGTLGSNQLTAVGSGAGFNSSSSDAAMGYKALYSNTTSATNTTLGVLSAYNSTAFANTAVGALALYTMVSGTENSAAGFQAMSKSRSGSQNTALGYRALQNNTGSQNLAIGNNALSTHVTGNRNTAVGYNASATIDGYTNTIAIGYNSTVSASNTVRFGDTNITTIEGQVAWTATSDARVKKDIKPSDLGLEFIMRLKPVSYRLIDGNGRIDYGFLAQDIEGILDGRITNMITKLNDKRGTYQLRSSDLIAPMVKAVQERQAIIDDLKRQIEELKKPICAGGDHDKT